MNTINELISLSTTINDKDKTKFDEVYNKVLYPLMKHNAERFKKREISIRENNSNPPLARKLKAMGVNETLQCLVETSMKPYLENKGFNVCIYNPNYVVYVKW